jgi:hypothetical protein
VIDAEDNCGFFLKCACGGAISPAPPQQQEMAEIQKPTEMHGTWRGVP